MSHAIQSKLPICLKKFHYYGALVRFEPIPSAIVKEKLKLKKKDLILLNQTVVTIYGKLF